MQNPIPSLAGFRRAASYVLRFALTGTGTVLDVTGTTLVFAGLALRVCGQKIKSFVAARPPDNPTATDHAAPQPA